MSETAPPTCRPAVLSVAVACHAAGCVVPSAQTIELRVVGEVPVTCNRTSSSMPGV